VTSSRAIGPTQIDMWTCGLSEPPTSLPSISSAAASPARTSARLARVLASTVRALVSGPSTRESCASFDPASSSWKTSQRSLLADSTESLATFPRAGMTRSGSLFALPMLGRHTDGNGCSSLDGAETWPTPRAAVASMYPEHGEHWNDNRGGVSLATKVWATPTSRDWKDGACADSNVPTNGLLGRPAVRAWPTPAGRDGDGRGVMAPTSAAMNRKRARGSMNAAGLPSDDLPAAVKCIAAGRLSAAWVEALMGFPPGWTVGPPVPVKRNTSGSRPARSRKKTTAPGG
jgi:hypothetical protein